MFQLNAAVSGRFLTFFKFYMYAKVILFQYIINNPQLQASFSCKTIDQNLLCGS